LAIRQINTEKSPVREDSYHISQFPGGHSGSGTKTNKSKKAADHSPTKTIHLQDVEEEANNIILMAKRKQGEGVSFLNYQRYYDVNYKR
jgi:hypothetical protein